MNINSPEVKKVLLEAYATATDGAFELAIGLFSDSMHDKWTTDEVIAALQSVRAVCAKENQSEIDKL